MTEQGVSVCWTQSFEVFKLEFWGTLLSTFSVSLTEQSVSDT